MNRIRPHLLVVLFAAAGTWSCASVQASSIPLANSGANATHPAHPHVLGADSTGVPERGAENAASSTPGPPSAGAVAEGKTDDVRRGVHQPSDDTRVNSGAGNATPVQSPGD